MHVLAIFRQSGCNRSESVWPTGYKSKRTLACWSWWVVHTAQSLLVGSRVGGGVGAWVWVVSRRVAVSGGRGRAAQHPLQPTRLVALVQLVPFSSSWGMGGGRSVVDARRLNFPIQWTLRSIALRCASTERDGGCAHLPVRLLFEHYKLELPRIKSRYKTRLFQLV